MKPTLAGIPLTNTLGENRQFSLQNMLTLCPFNSLIVWYFPSKFAHMHLCGIHYKLLWPNWWKSNSFGDIDAIIWDNARHGPYVTSAWPRNPHEPSIHHGYSSVRWWYLAAKASPIGSNQVWRLRDVGSLPRIELTKVSLHRIDDVRQLVFSEDGELPTTVSLWSHGHVGIVQALEINTKWKNTIQRTGTLSQPSPGSKSVNVFIKFQSATGS